MFSINGIGTSLYGKSELESDGSYVATKWFVFIFLPIVPLGSYRVMRGETSASMTALVGLPGANTQYEMVSIPLNWKQIGQTYLAVLGAFVIIGIVTLEVVYFQTFYLLIFLSCLGYCYAVYSLFKNDQKWWAILLIISVLVIGFSLLIS